MVEPEMAFVELEENMQWAEKLVFNIIKNVLEYCHDELMILERNIKKLESIVPPFPRITYKEAVQILNEMGIVLNTEVILVLPMKL